MRMMELVHSNPMIFNIYCFIFVVLVCFVYVFFFFYFIFLALFGCFVYMHAFFCRLCLFNFCYILIAYHWCSSWLTHSNRHSLTQTLSLSKDILYFMKIYKHIFIYTFIVKQNHHRYTNTHKHTQNNIYIIIYILYYHILPLSFLLFLSSFAKATRLSAFQRVPTCYTLVVWFIWHLRIPNVSGGIPSFFSGELRALVSYSIYSILLQIINHW